MFPSSGPSPDSAMELQVDDAALCGAVLLLALVVAGGCASSHVPDERPRTLTEVNEQLGERWARIAKTDGRRIEHVENVQVGPDSTTFYHRFDQEHRALPTASIRTVQIRSGSGAGDGFLTGAAPGIAAVFMGGAIAVAHSGEENSGPNVAALAGLTLVGGGLLAGLVGGTIGAVVGDATIEEEWITVYRRPVSRYRQ